ncbi:hypothetical protein CSW14_12035 [Thermus scotoductus]|uniref:Uncharacterized protein n=1 Tax=Thermus scotoductus TaxID=37636 RepID=A0A430VCM2_THESC|nr:hypothetical protein CSW14_12035 [Thermus scotoductus]
MKRLEVYEIRGVAFGSLWLFLGMVARLTFQFIALVLLGRSLNSEQLGFFLAVLSLSQILSHVFELGGYSLTIRDLQRGEGPRRALENSLALSVRALPLTALLAFVLKMVVFPSASWVEYIFFVSASLFSNRLVLLVYAAWVGLGRLMWAGVSDVIAGFAFLLAAIMAEFLRESWALLYFMQSLIVACFALFMAWRAFGPVRVLSGVDRARLTAGVHFASGSLLQSLTQELDKVLLARLASPQDVSVYGLAMRLVSVPIFALSALLAAGYPAFFAKGAEGTAAVLRYGIRFFGFALALSLLAGLTLYWAAPWLTGVLFPTQPRVSEALRLLSILPALMVPAAVLGNILTGLDRQKIRVFAQVASLVVSLPLYFLLIPTHGWAGAGYATLSSMGVQSVLMGILVYSITRWGVR